MEVDASGLVTWTPATDQLGEHSVTVRVEDGRGGWATQGFTISVQQKTANTAPSITSVPPFTARVDQLYAYNAVAVDPQNDPIVWSLASAPKGMSIDALRGTVRWVPSSEQTGFQEVVIQATDMQGASGIQGFGINVGVGNSPPVVVSAPSTHAMVNDTYAYHVRVFDADNDSIRFALETFPDGMTMDTTTGLIQWMPAANQIGSHEVVIQVDDGRGGMAEQSFTLTVTGDDPNLPPVITSRPEFLATVEKSFEYQMVGSDPEGLSLSYQLIAGPAGMHVDAASGLVTWTPTADHLGPNSVQLAAFDPLGLGASQTFTVTVRDDNRQPILNNTPVTTTAARRLYAFDMDVSDPDDDPIIYTLISGPEGMTLDELGRLRWTPTLEDVGVHRVDLAIQDERGAGFTVGYDLTVVVDTKPPQIVINATANPVGIGEVVTIWVGATDNIAVESIGLEVDGNTVPLDGAAR